MESGGRDATAPSPPPAGDSTSKNTLTQPSPSTSDGFFRLPIEIRRIIYDLVLAIDQSLYLFREGARIRSFASEIPRKWRALLYTCRKMHRETAVVVYSSNRFTLVDTTGQTHLLQYFLDTIGPANAGTISHLAMGFPDVNVRADQTDQSRVGEESIRTIELIRERCTSLTTLETMMHGQIAWDMARVDDDNLSVVEDVLFQVDALLRQISSLNRVFVRVYGNAPTPLAMEAMQRLGWVVFKGDQEEAIN